VHLAQHSALLDRVLALSPEITARSEETERNRAVPPDLMRKLREAGLFRLMVPKSLGGEELSLLQAVRVIEALARADGSAGWNAMVIFGYNVAIGRFPREAFERVFANGPDVVMRGALAPLGKATASEGGYLIAGQWPFASGSYDPEWIVASGRVYENGVPRSLPSGEPKMMMALLPGDAARFLDTWDTVGLRGSSSHDFVIDDRFVSEGFMGNLFDPTVPSQYHTPLLRLPFRTLAGPTHSAVVVGIAQGALEDIIELSHTKRGAFTPGMLLADDPVFKHRIGQLSARLATVRGALDRMVLQIEQRAASHAATTPYDSTEASALVSFAHSECVTIVDEIFALGGSTPIYRSSPIQRRWRDVRCATQHVGASPGNYSKLGDLLVAEPEAQASRVAAGG